MPWEITTVPLPWWWVLCFGELFFFPAFAGSEEEWRGQQGRGEAGSLIVGNLLPQGKGLERQ